MSQKNVVVVGGGNAALCAALSAADNGARVTLFEWASKEERGGNTFFTAGAMRVAHEGEKDILRLAPDLPAEQLAITDFGTYDEAAFFDDIARVTEYRADPDLAETLVSKSMPTLEWMRDKGVRFAPIYGRQAFLHEGRYRFWGGLTIEVVGGGPGLVEALTNTARKEGVEIRYNTRVTGLQMSGSRVSGVHILCNGVAETLACDAVVLASGGFEANAEWRARSLGPGWELAKVRGSAFNYGDGIRMALDVGASPAGHWSGCHSVQWDRNAPEFGDLAVGDGFQKHSYPWGIVVNANGERFIDEGADFRNYTYAKYGRRVLEQPNQIAWQIFDGRVEHFLRDEYRIKEVTRVTANSLPELAAKIDGIDKEAFLRNVEEYNRAVRTDIEFNPNEKDGRGTAGLAVPKSNWANPIDTPPFHAYAVTCGITFTFGGVRIDNRARVLDVGRQPIPGLYAAGEMTGGLFYFNYPGGSGLTNGSVFGKLAGAGAATAA